MRRFAPAWAVAVLVAVNAAALWLAGWVAVPVLGALWGALAPWPRERAGVGAAAATSALAAFLGWLLALAIAAVWVPVWSTTGAVAGLMGVPPAGFLLLGPLLGALLAGSAAVLGRTVHVTS